jgi:hypothetical protein
MNTCATWGKDLGQAPAFADAGRAHFWQRSEDHRAVSPVFARLRLAAARQPAHPEHGLTLLLTHLLQNYSNVQWKLPVVTGGLSPFVLRNVLAFIEENLGQP